MKVLFDAYWWNSGPPSGRRVLQQTVISWREQFPEDELFGLIPHGEDSSDAARYLKVHTTRIRPHAVAVLSVMPGLARQTGADWTFTQNFGSRSPKNAVFVHDVLFQSNPDWFTRRERLYLSFIPRALRYPSLILTSSETEAQRIRTYNSVGQSVHAVGLGVDRNLAASDPTEPDNWRNVDKFVLAVGRLNYRKNLGTLLNAAALSSRVTSHTPLVVVGQRDGRGEVELSPLARAAVESGAIRFLGGVPDNTLKWLYQHASALFFASLDEGFGLPPLEAHSFGTPLVLSDISVLREIYGDVARFTPALDVEGWRIHMDYYLGPQQAPSGPIRPLTDMGWDNVVVRIRQLMKDGQAQ